MGSELQFMRVPEQDDPNSLRHTPVCFALSALWIRERAVSLGRRRFAPCPRLICFGPLAQETARTRGQETVRALAQETARTRAQETVERWPNRRHERGQ